MKLPTTLAASAILLSACASMGDAPMVEQGYVRGSLAVAAIDRGDWKEAEARLLKAEGVAADDPARLLNLGKVYWETGREDEAVSVWRQALASDKEVQLETLGGRILSSRDIAREALARYGRVQTAAR